MVRTLNPCSLCFLSSLYFMSFRFFCSFIHSHSFQWIRESVLTPLLSSIQACDAFLVAHQCGHLTTGQATLLGPLMTVDGATGGTNPSNPPTTTTTSTPSGTLLQGLQGLPQSLVELQSSPQTASQPLLARRVALEAYLNVPRTPLARAYILARIQGRSSFLVSCFLVFFLFYFLLVSFPPLYIRRDMNPDLMVDAGRCSLGGGRGIESLQLGRRHGFQTDTHLPCPKMDHGIPHGCRGTNILLLLSYAVLFSSVRVCVDSVSVFLQFYG